jgi:Protein of unknown function (DUF3667)
MTNNAGPLYEIDLAIAGEVLADVEIWLQELQRTAMHQRGIESARVFEHNPDAGGRAIRTCQFQAHDDHALDELLDGFFSDIDAEAAARFGDQVSIQSRILRSDDSIALPPGTNPNCLNCGTRLRGQYCGHCGQRSRNRLISIWQLLREAFGDLLELDSRLWRTLVPLLTRPGQLTRDYLEGRRARYMPPFRTYLVLSVIFFVVAFFDPQQDLRLLFVPEQPPETAAQTTSGDESKLVTIVASEDTGLFGDCENATISDEADLPEWFKKRFSDERVKKICERNVARGNENLADAMADNIPVALIVLLPLMALVLKVLYPLSRRYFVEHLLFFVHFHAFFFLLLIVQILFARIVGMLGPEDGTIDNISNLTLVIASFYIPVYLYKAMRHVYGQGHLVTMAKYLMLAVAYLSGVTFTMLAAILVAVLSA